MQNAPLLIDAAAGLYCPIGDFHIDPHTPVRSAVLTHAHSDHASRGHAQYLACRAGEAVYRYRLGAEANLQFVDYGERVTHNGVTISFHPAGHVLGSAQIRVEHQGEVWVASGDYKLTPDPTCAPFEPVRCHTFITEATFGLPLYRWPAPAQVMGDINAWWRDNREQGKVSLVLAYAFGKAQRVLAGVDASIGPLFTHGAVEPLNDAYRAQGVALPPTRYVGAIEKKSEFEGGLVIAPPSAQGTTWTRRFGKLSTGFASGWMLVRGARRRRALDRGFVLSDHADWPELLQAIESARAERVYVTHGYIDELVRWLNERGQFALPLKMNFHGEGEPPIENVAESMAV